jgi:hypothetical protein
VAYPTSKVPVDRPLKLTVIPTSEISDIPMAALPAPTLMVWTPETPVKLNCLGVTEDAVAAKFTTSTSFMNPPDPKPSRKLPSMATLIVSTALPPSI